MKRIIAAASLLGTFLWAGDLLALQDRPTIQLREALKDNAENFWIYDDLDEGYTRGRDTGKPILVSIR